MRRRTCRPIPRACSRWTATRMSEHQADTLDQLDGGEPLETLLQRDPIELAGDKDKPDAAARGRELLSIYLSDIAKVPLLTPDEEQELARRVQKGDAEAERRLTEANLRLVVRVARRYLNRGLSLLDRRIPNLRRAPVSLPRFGQERTWRTCSAICPTRSATCSAGV